MQVIFQDPMASLNPRLTLGDAVMEGLKIHYPELKEKHRDMVLEMFEKVGLSPAMFFYNNTHTKSPADSGKEW